MKSNFFLGLLLLVVSVVWGGSFLVVKQTVSSINPVDLGFFRFLVATPLMLLVLGMRRSPGIPFKKEFGWLVVLGLSGVTLLYLFQYVGILYTNASTSAVLINTNVIFIAVFSALFLKERVSWKRVAGILLSFLGVFGVVFSNLSFDQFTLGNMFFFGCVCILCSAFCWAIYTVVGKKLLQSYDPFSVTTYAFGLGTLFYLPLVVMHLPGTFLQVSFEGWLAIVYLAVLCSVFGYLGWYYALTKIEANRAAIFLNFIPLSALVMSFFIGETLTPVFLLGTACILYGFHLAYQK